MFYGESPIFYNERNGKVMNTPSSLALWLRFVFFNIYSSNAYTSQGEGNLQVSPIELYGV